MQNFCIHVRDKLLRAVMLIIITLFQEGDIYITIVNHDGPQNNRKYAYAMQKNYIKIKLV